MSDQNSTTPDPNEAVPGYQPPETPASASPAEPPAYTPPSAPEPPAYPPPASEPPATPPSYEPPATPPSYEPPATPPSYEPPATPPSYEPPATPPSYEPPATPPSYEPPATPPPYEPPSAQPPYPPQTGGYEPPAAGAYSASAGGYEPPSGGYQQPMSDGGYPPPPGGGYAGAAGTGPSEYPPPGGYPPPPGSYQPSAAAAPVGGRVDIGAALSYGWRKFAANPVPFILLLLISSVLTFVVYFIGIAIIGGVIAVANNDSSGSATGTAVVLASILGIVVTLIAVFIALAVNMGLQRAAIDTARGVPVSVGSAFRRDDLGQYLTLWAILVGGLLVANIVLSFIPVIGPIVSFLLSIAASVLFFFAPFLVLDRRMPAMEALKTSYSMAMANIGQTILVVLVVGLVAGIGSILCGVGALVTVPLAMIAAASIYLSLQGESSAP